MELLQNPGAVQEFTEKALLNQRNVKTSNNLKIHKPKSQQVQFLISHRTKRQTQSNNYGGFTPLLIFRQMVIKC